MDTMLQRHCARYIYVVPDGLRELMTDVSREVLRSQPEDIYTFIADYLDALLIVRENARVSAKFVVHMTEEAETIVELLNRTGMSREEVDRTASVIQEAFRAWSERKGILKEDDDKVVARIVEDADISESQIQTAAVVIQHAFKSYKMKKEKEQRLLSGIIDWRVAARSAIKLYRRTGVSPEEAKKAADLIKAAYKGYYTRRAIQQLNEEVHGSFEEDMEAESDEDEASVTSPSDKEERKAKGVRIDFNTTIPHVDFGDEELITRDEPSIAEEPTYIAQEDVQKRTKDLQNDSEYVISILQEIIDSVVDTEGIDEAVLPFEDKDSDIMDDFIPPPVGDTEEPLYNRAVPLPLVSQEELEEELDQARQEMMQLTTDNGNRLSRSSKAPTSQDMIRQGSRPSRVASKTKDTESPSIRSNQPEQPKQEEAGDQLPQEGASVAPTQEEALEASTEPATAEPPQAEITEPSQSVQTETDQPGESAVTETEQPVEPVATESEQPGEPVAAETDQPGEPTAAETDQPGEPAAAETVQPGEPVVTETPGEPAAAETVQPGEPVVTEMPQDGISKEPSVAESRETETQPIAEEPVLPPVEENVEVQEPPVEGTAEEKEPIEQ